MTELIVKDLETELLALLKPFRTSDNEDGGLHTEASDLLNFVENVFTSTHEAAIGHALWHDFLDVTGRPDFLGSLPSAELRNRWADHMFRIVDHSQYSLLKMFEQRVSEHPERILFREADNFHSLWSYERVFFQMRKIAAAFYAAVDQPRVMLYLDNSPDGACADLACLTFGILDSPIDRHFDRDTIAFIVERLGINIVVTDTEARLHRLIEVQKQTGISLKIFVTDPNNRVLRENDLFVGEACTQLSTQETDNILARLPAQDLHAVSTVMITGDILKTSFRGPTKRTHRYSVALAADSGTVPRTTRPFGLPRGRKCRVS